MPLALLLATAARGALRRIGSQVGQDEWVLQTLGYKRGGTFLDVGAHNGESNSNSVVMERVYGWSGICIEANPATFALMEQRRSCVALDHVLGDGSVVDFCDLDELGGIVGLEVPSLHRRRASHSRNVQSVPLADALAAAGAPPVIDFLSIDIEGAELMVLQSLDFSRFRFRTITVEHNAPHVGPEYRQRLRSLLERNGYRWVKGNDDVQAWGHGPIDDFYVFDGDASSAQLQSEPPAPSTPTAGSAISAKAAAAAPTIAYLPGDTHVAAPLDLGS